MSIALMVRIDALEKKVAALEAEFAGARSVSPAEPKRAPDAKKPMPKFRGKKKVR